MGSLTRFLKPIVTAGVIFISALAGPVLADTLDELFSELQAETPENWEATEDLIWKEWSRSGSASMDLLLRRGREAIEAGDFRMAIEHLSALVDHAPEFAEGWNARATAYFHADLLGPSVQDIGRTLALNPRHFGALSGLGQILERTGFPDKALEAYRAALEIHPHRPDLKEAVARMERAAGGFEL